MSNSTLSVGYILSGTVVGVHTPFWNPPGFAIPLIRKGLFSNALYIQKTDLEGRIIGFDHSDFLKQHAVSKTDYAVELGDREVFAILDPNGRIVIGSKEELSSDVRRWVAAIKDPVTRFSFARFCDDLRLQSLSASQAFEHSRSTMHTESAAISWLFSALIEIDIRNLVSRDIDGFIAEPNVPISDKDGLASSGYSLIYTNAQILIDFDDFDISKERLATLRRNRRFVQLSSIVRSATGRELTFSTRRVERRNAKQFSFSLDSVAEAQKRILKIKRQEERLATIIIYLLTDSDVGLELINSYVDRTRFMSETLEKLRLHIGNQPQVDLLELKIAKWLPSIISSSYPYRRGQLVAILADFLGEFKHISATLREIVAKSSDPSIASVRNYVESRPRD